MKFLLQIEDWKIDIKLFYLEIEIAITIRNLFTRSLGCTVISILAIFFYLLLLTFSPINTTYATENLTNQGYRIGHC